jgi:hypothetical protein
MRPTVLGLSFIALAMEVRLHSGASGGGVASRGLVHKEFPQWLKIDGLAPALLLLDASVAFLHEVHAPAARLLATNPKRRRNLLVGLALGGEQNNLTSLPKALGRDSAPRLSYQPCFVRFAELNHRCNTHPLCLSDPKLPATIVLW